MKQETWYQLVECGSDSSSGKPETWEHGYFVSSEEACNKGRFENYGKELTSDQYKEFMSGNLNIDDLYAGGGPATAFAVIPMQRHPDWKLGFIP